VTLGGFVGRVSGEEVPLARFEGEASGGGTTLAGITGKASGRHLREESRYFKKNVGVLSTSTTHVDEIEQTNKEARSAFSFMWTHVAWPKQCCRMPARGCPEGMASMTSDTHHQ